MVYTCCWSAHLIDTDQTHNVYHLVIASSFTTRWLPMRQHLLAAVIFLRSSIDPSGYFFRIGHTIVSAHLFSTIHTVTMSDIYSYSVSFQRSQLFRVLLHLDARLTDTNRLSFPSPLFPLVTWRARLSCLSMLRASVVSLILSWEVICRSRLMNCIFP